MERDKRILFNKEKMPEFSEDVKKRFKVDGSKYMDMESSIVIGFENGSSDVAMKINPMHIPSLVETVRKIGMRLMDESMDFIIDTSKDPAIKELAINAKKMQKALEDSLEKGIDL